MGKLCTSKTVLVACVLAGLLYVLKFSPLQQYVTTEKWSLLDGGSSQDQPDLLPAMTKSHEPVLNPQPFTFSLNSPDKCKDQDVFLLIIVTTPPEAQAQRQAIRQTWGDETNIPGVGIRTVFAVGVSDDVGIQQALQDESETFGDVVQENFADTHRNATLKTIMCLKWASQFCPNAKYVMKASPDTFVNIFSLVKYLKTLPASRATKFLVGWVNTDKKPVRDPNSPWRQWYVPRDEYPNDTYPPYASGFAYVMSNDMPRLLYETSLTTKYLFMEDVYIGICMEKLGIAPKHHGNFCHWYVEINSCKFEWLIVSRGVGNPETMRKFWKALTSKC